MFINTEINVMVLLTYRTHSCAFSTVGRLKNQYTSVLVQYNFFYNFATVFSIKTEGK